MELAQQQPFERAAPLLALLLDQPTVHWSRDELHLHLGWSDGRLDDALAELERDGLAHRQSGFTWPTRAAVRAFELLA
jgi:hypothetical protein